MKMKLLLSTVVLTMILLSCSTAKKAEKGTSAEQLEGTWELQYMQGKEVDELYARRKPFIRFDLEAKRVSGNTGCNSFSGPLVINDDSINFNQPFAMTKMFCEGVDEQAFLEAMERVETFRVKDDVLEMLNGDVVVMRFKIGAN